MAIMKRKYTRRNVDSTHRKTAANDRRTAEQLERYEGRKSLLDEWESQPDDVQIKNHAYILRLRAEVRQFKNYLLHRADPRAKV